LNSSSSIAPLSANQGRIVNTALGQKEDADATIMKSGELQTDIHSGGTDKAVSAETLKTALDQNYATEVFISDLKTIPQNIQRLENAIVAMETADTLFSYKTLYAPILAATGSNYDATGSFYFKESRENKTIRKVKVAYYKQSNDVRLVLNGRCEMSKTGMEAYLTLEHGIFEPSGSTEITYQGGGPMPYEIEVDIENDLAGWTEALIGIRTVDLNSGGILTLTDPELRIKTR